MIANNNQISQYISTQFPNIYRDEQPQLIAFVQAYYEYLESTNQPLYYSRNINELHDIDSTIDDFIVNFKNKYFVGINYDTKADIRMLIKHALDLYRSKGTERALDLLFRILYNEIVEVYYPKSDLLYCSSGKWIIPQYLELSISTNNTKLLHKQIIGLKSKGTAFVDNIVRRVNIFGRIIDIAYISGIEGAFAYNEIVYPIDQSLPQTLCPTVIGSVNDIDISSSGTGSGFAVGDVIELISDMNGESGKGLVVAVDDSTNILDIITNDGGYGYVANSVVYGSNNIVSVSINAISNNYARDYIRMFEPITQTQGNTSGIYIGTTKVIAKISNVVGSFTLNEHIHQYNETANDFNHVCNHGIIDNFSENFITITNINGLFKPQQHIYGHPSGATGFVDFVTISVGVANVSGGFTTVGNNEVQSEYFTGNCTYVSSSVQGGFAITGNLSYAESISLNTDILQPYGSTPLANGTYQFPGNTSANGLSIFSDYLTFANSTIGKIYRVDKSTSADPSAFTGLDANPVVVPYEERTYPNHYDLEIQYSNQTGSFVVGEVITQSATSGRGLVTGISNNTLIIQNLRYLLTNRFVPTTNSTTTIVGTTSGTVANGDIVSNTYIVRHTGLNANVQTTAITGQGVITQVSVTDSGFGYINGEKVWIVKSGVAVDVDSGTGYVEMSTSGRGSGFYSDSNGFVSDVKKVFDGEYYQNYSYEVISSKTLDKYRDTLKKLIHVAGTKLFGRLKHNVAIDHSIDAQLTDITTGTG